MALARERMDPDWELVEEIVERMRSSPADFADVEDVARASGLGSSKLHELFRRHFHATPAQLLARARVGAASRLLIQTARSVTDIAFEVGYEGLSTFNENFRRLQAMSPLEYRRLLGARSFRIALPPGYLTAPALKYLGREGQSLTIRAEGSALVTALRLGGVPALLRAELADGMVAASIESSRPLPEDAAVQAHAQLLALLGLSRDPAPFEKAVAALPRLSALLQGRAALRIPLIPEPFDALTWVIVGQQVNLPFAFTLRRRLVEKTGEPAGEGLFAPPTPEAVANLDPEDLVRNQFSGRKAEYLIGTARLVAEGKLPLGRLAAAPATRIEQALLAVRGLGPWSASYLMMRCFGFEDCVPVGDSGLVRGLMKLYGLPTRPDVEETQELMRPFAPYRSWATFHLWQMLKEEP